MSQAVSPPNRPVSTMTRQAAGRAHRSGQPDAGTDPIQLSPVAARCAKLASEFCPASKTTVTSAASASAPAAAQAASYWVFRASTMAGNWVTSGRSPG